MWLVALIFGILLLFFLKEKPRLRASRTAETQNSQNAPSTSDVGINLASDKSCSYGIAIYSVRVLSGLILAVVWPIATFLLPFLFDDPREGAALGRFVFLALYLGYPVVFFHSAEKYKSQLSCGNYVKALTQALSPIGLLVIFLVLLWASSLLKL